MPRSARQVSLVPYMWTPCQTRGSASCSRSPRPWSVSIRPIVREEFALSKANSFRVKIGATLGGAADETRERQPDDGLRVGRFGWPEGARLRYYDEAGNRISKEEWRELGRRKAEKRKRDKAAG